jgi:hypothetical protein
MRRDACVDEPRRLREGDKVLSRPVRHRALLPRPRRRRTSPARRASPGRPCSRPVDYARLSVAAATTWSARTSRASMNAVLPTSRRSSERRAAQVGSAQPDPLGRAADPQPHQREQIPHHQIHERPEQAAPHSTDGKKLEPKRPNMHREPRTSLRTLRGDAARPCGRETRGARARRVPSSR